jgi:hypothetical protein
MSKYPKVEYYCEETIYEFGVGVYDCRFWFDTNKSDLKNHNEVEELALDVFADCITCSQTSFAKELANAMKPHGLNALSVKASGLPAYMIYTTPFQEGESCHG